MRKLNLRKVVGIECINMIDVFNGKEKYLTWVLELDNGKMFATQTLSASMTDVRKKVYLGQIIPL